MFEKLEKMMLTGLGAVSISQKKVEELVAEMKEKYRMSEEEGRAFMEKFQKMAREGQEKLQEMAEIEVRKTIERLGMVTREDFELLQRRVTVLESRMKSMSIECEVGPEC